MPHEKSNPYKSLFSDHTQLSNLDPDKKKIFLSLKKVKKDIDTLKNAIKAAEKLLRENERLSANEQKKLMGSIKKGHEKLAIYETKLKTMEKNVMGL